METSHSYFFTASIYKWKNLLLETNHKNIIIDSLKYLVNQKRIKLYAFVIMPNHIHLIWQMCNDHKKEDVQRDFLKYTAQMMKFNLKVHYPINLEEYKVNQKGRAYQFWQNRPLSIELYSESVFEQKLDYIHNNPIQEKWQLCTLAEEYEYSSASFYLENQSKWSFLTHYKD